MRILLAISGYLGLLVLTLLHVELIGLADHWMRLYRSIQVLDRTDIVKHALVDVERAGHFLRLGLAGIRGSTIIAIETDLIGHVQPLRTRLSFTILDEAVIVHVDGVLDIAVHDAWLHEIRVVRLVSRILMMVLLYIQLNKLLHGLLALVQPIKGLMTVLQLINIFVRHFLLQTESLHVLRRLFEARLVACV